MSLKSKYNYIKKWSKKVRAIELLGGKCEHCGETRPWVLSFHHKNPKEKECHINTISDKQWSVIEKEIQKCIVLCENCHREIHKEIIGKETVYDESKKILLDIKSISGCEQCSYNEYNGALDFHHLKDKDKNFNIGSIRLCENSCDEVKEKILEEANKCIVLCANCHRDLHFDKEKFKKYKEDIYNKIYKVYKEQLSKSNKEEIVNLYNQGMLQSDIAKKFNKNKSVICYIIKHTNGVIKQNKISLDKEIIIKLYNDGMTQVEIAKKFQKCSKTIWRIINNK